MSKMKKIEFKSLDLSKLKKMLNFKSLKAKILVPFMVVIGLVIIMATITTVNIINTNSNTEEMVDEELALLIADDQLSLSISQRIAAARGYILFGDAMYKNLFDQYTEKSKEYQEQLLTLSGSEEVQNVINKTSDWEEQVITDVFGRYDKGDVTGATSYLHSSVEPYSNALIQDYEKLTTSRVASITNKADSVIDLGKQSLILTIIISLLVILFGISIALLFFDLILTDPFLFK